MILHLGLLEINIFADNGQQTRFLGIWRTWMKFGFDNLQNIYIHHPCHSWPANPE